MPQIRRMHELLHELSSVQAAALPQIRHMHEQLHELSSEIADQKAINREISGSTRRGTAWHILGPQDPRSLSRNRMTSKQSQLAAHPANGG